MCTLPSLGAVKPLRKLLPRSGPVKAAPWTVTPSAGTSTAVMASSRKMCTFSGHSTVSQGLPGPYQSWFPGAAKTWASIRPRASARASPVSR